MVLKQTPWHEINNHCTTHQSFWRHFSQRTYISLLVEFLHRPFRITFCLIVYDWILPLVWRCSKMDFVTLRSPLFIQIESADFSLSVFFRSNDTRLSLYFPVRMLWWSLVLRFISNAILCLIWYSPWLPLHGDKTITIIKECANPNWWIIVLLFIYLWFSESYSTFDIFTLIKSQPLRSYHLITNMHILADIIIVGVPKGLDIGSSLYAAGVGLCCLTWL